MAATNTLDSVSMQRAQDEKDYGIDHNENGLDSGSEKHDDYYDFSPAQQRAITRKLDIRLVFITGLIYCISLMDRTNLPNASLAGMRTSLRMTVANNGYSITTLVFFTSYIAFQPPATFLCRKIGPRVFLSTITLGWGVVMIGMGFVNYWTELAGLRVILGIFEAGYFPGAVYLLSTWYTRYEMGKRYAVFYTIGCVASAFAGILAYGLSEMRGVANLQGWRWIFIMEGVLTCVIAGVGATFLVSFPDANAHKHFGFLKKEEVAWVMRKVDNDRGDVKLEPFTLARFLKGGKDWKIWCFALIFCFSTTVAYSLSYFLPIILNEGMKFNVVKSQCLVAPPYAFAGMWMYACGWFGDRYRLRAPIIAVNALFQILGLTLMGWGGSNAVRYFGVFFACAGCNCNVPATLTYQANNIRGQWKRAFCSASLVGFGGIGGIAGGLVFRPQDTPDYIPGLTACIVASVLTLCLLVILTLHFRVSNKKADRGEIQIEGSEGGFRYTF